MSNPSTALKREDWRLKSARGSDRAAKSDSGDRDPNRPEIVVCHGSGCMANGSPKVTDAMQGGPS